MDGEEEAILARAPPALPAEDRHEPVGTGVLAVYRPGLTGPRPKWRQGQAASWKTGGRHLKEALGSSLAAIDPSSQPAHKQCLHGLDREREQLLHVLAMDLAPPCSPPPSQAQLRRAEAARDRMATGFVRDMLRWNLALERRHAGAGRAGAAGKGLLPDQQQTGDDRRRRRKRGRDKRVLLGYMGISGRGRLPTPEDARAYRTNWGSELSSCSRKPNAGVMEPSEISKDLVSIVHPTLRKVHEGRPR
ncbi:hypothetical protein PG991_014427 [Apiospora marii]|uniref:Uncharacterized protein n=1 Tax=Apiospora marii TaxID=335849 RepID=A0ABR1R9R2_9PEZI